MRSLQPELGVKICHKKYPNPEMLASNLHTKHVMVKCNTNVQLKIQPFLFKIKSSLGFQSDIIFFISHHPVPFSLSLNSKKPQIPNTWHWLHQPISPKLSFSLFKINIKT